MSSYIHNFSSMAISKSTFSHYFSFSYQTLFLTFSNVNLCWTLLQKILNLLPYVPQPNPSYYNDPFNFFLWLIYILITTLSFPFSASSLFFSVHVQAPSKSHLNT